MKAIYSEDGEIYEVEVLADRSDDEAWRYRLRRIDTGTEFNFMKRKDGAGWAGMGVLRFADGRVVPDNVISFKM
jgi:hypothetical protein